MIEQQRRWVTTLAFVAGISGLGLQARADFGTYIALGDSLAFGVGFDDTTADISNGDRGYVKGLANFLQAGNGGVRPTVFNYAISGETSGGFSTVNAGVHGSIAAARNTNYPATDPQTVSQKSQVIGRIASEHALGHQVSLITVQLGSNDLNMLLLNPSFAALTPAQQQAQMLATLTTFSQNSGALLQQLKTLAPEAKIMTIGYYDPFAPFLNINPTNATEAQLKYTAGLTGQAIPLLNQTIGNVAQSLGVNFLNIMPSFVGKEFTHTYIAAGNVHPTQVGYDMITHQLAVAVPEPSSFVLVGLGVACLVGIGRRSGVSKMVA